MAASQIMALPLDKPTPLRAGSNRCRTHFICNKKPAALIFEIAAGTAAA
jgi:hypothetical protein